MSNNAGSGVFVVVVVVVEPIVAGRLYFTYTDVSRDLDPRDDFLREYV